MILTKTNPSTHPPWYATLNACPNPKKALKHVLAFAFVAIFIPMYPHNIDVTAPVTNAIVVNPVPGTASA